MIPNPNMQNGGPQNFMQRGPINNATSGGQAYNFMSGGRPTATTTLYAPGNKTSPRTNATWRSKTSNASRYDDATRYDQTRPMNPFGHQNPPPLPQGTQVPPNMETKSSITDPIDMNKISNFSVYHECFKES